MSPSSSCWDGPPPFSSNSLHPSGNSPVGLTRGWSSRWCTCGWFHLVCEGVTRTPQRCWQRRAQLWCQLGVRGLNRKGEKREKWRAQKSVNHFYYSVCTVLRIFSFNVGQIGGIWFFFCFPLHKWLKHKTSMWYGTPHCGLQYLTCCVANQHVKYHYNHPHAATLQFFSLHF